MTARLVAVVLIAVGLLAAGCGSQQGSPLSVAKMKSAFASAGIPVGPYHGRSFGRPPVPPVAFLARVWDGSILFVSVFPSAASGLRAIRPQNGSQINRLQTNPRLHNHVHVTRVQNVVLVFYGPHRKLPSHLQVAIQHLRASG
jgi:hypothetical protein